MISFCFSVVVGFGMMTLLRAGIVTRGNAGTKSAPFSVRLPIMVSTSCITLYVRIIIISICVRIAICPTVVTPGMILAPGVFTLRITLLVVIIIFLIIVIGIMKIPNFDESTRRKHPFINVRTIRLVSNIPLQSTGSLSFPPFRHQRRLPHGTHTDQRGRNILIPRPNIINRRMIPQPYLIVLHLHTDNHQMLHPPIAIGIRIGDHGLRMLFGVIHKFCNGAGVAGKSGEGIMMMSVPIVGEVGIDGEGGPSVVLGGEDGGAGGSSFAQDEADYGFGVDVVPVYGGGVGGFATAAAIIIVVVVVVVVRMALAIVHAFSELIVADEAAGVQGTVESNGFEGREADADIA
mmetsp:Transcript_24278/g.48379  ORF Transcript_24278/g.48379 Transcript_24278/m.48379 type:complete len:348 (-) Transcript_24278:7-1050(-)